MSDFVSGAIAMGCVASGLFFIRFWRRTQDRLFAAFAVAFLAMALERLLQSQLSLNDDPRGLGFVLRLGAFVLIVIAILRKNSSIK